MNISINSIRIQKRHTVHTSTQNMLVLIEIAYSIQKRIVSF